MSTVIKERNVRIIDEYFETQLREMREIRASLCQLNGSYLFFHDIACEPARKIPKPSELYSNPCPALNCCSG